jgi:Tol biopolymer transport system component
MFIRDAVVNNYIPPIQALDQLSYLNYRYGHAVFDYIEQEFGEEGVRNFVYEYRKVLLTGNIEKAVKEAFGTDIDAFNRNFNRFLRKRYFPVLLEKKSPDDYGKEIGIQKPGVFTFSPTISPSGELVAAIASPKMEADLVVLSAEDGKKVKNLTKGWSNKYRYIVTEAFQGRRDLSWSPTGDQIAVIVRKENRRDLAIYDSLHGKLERMIRLPGIAQSRSPAFSPDGKRVAFEGNKDGVVDIFELDLATKAIRNLTQDDDYDGNPWYAADGTTLLYNRRIGESWKIFSVDLSDPTRKTQLTFGPGLDIQPSYSRDGKSVFFASDRGGFGSFNIFSLDLASGATRQYTDVVGGCFTPVEMAPRNGEPYLVVSAYFNGTFRLYSMPLRQAESTAPPETTVAGAPEPEPFAPPLALKADVAQAKPYKLRWDLEAPSISVGVTDDGTFLSNVGLGFSDLLGDHRVGVQYYSVASFSNFLVSYINMKHRTRWGASVFDLRDYYLSSDGFNVDRRQTQRATGAQFFVQYPFSRHYRLDTAVSAVDSTQDLFVGYDGGGIPQFVASNDRFVFLEPSVVGDTTRFQSFGPYQGHRFELGARYGKNVSSNDTGDIEEFHVDFRAYKQLTRRSLFAFRLYGVVNEGDREIFYGIGGLNTLRGYDFRDFYGSNVAMGNVELRFPFVDELRFPFGPISDIRGFLFLDAGTAWLPEGQFYDPDLNGVRPPSFPFDWWDNVNNRPQDLRASYGAGFQFLFIGGLQLNWAWSKRFTYSGFDIIDDPTTPGIFDLIIAPVKRSSSGLHSEFYITFDW